MTGLRGDGVARPAVRCVPQGLSAGEASRWAVEKAPCLLGRMGGLRGASSRRTAQTQGADPNLLEVGSATQTLVARAPDPGGLSRQEAVRRLVEVMGPPFDVKAGRPSRAVVRGER